MEQRISGGLRATFLVHMIVGVVLGGCYLLIPRISADLVSWPIVDEFPYRLLGAAILGFTAGSWLAYRDPIVDKVKNIVRMEIVWTALGAAVLVYAMVAYELPAIGWLNAVMMAGFAVAFSAFYPKKA